jgi:hypothetical protein
MRIVGRLKLQQTHSYSAAAATAPPLLAILTLNQKVSLKIRPEENFTRNIRRKVAAQEIQS